MNDLNEALKIAIPVAIGFGLLFVFRLLFNRLTPYDDSKIKQNGGLAAKAARTTRLGAYLGYAVAVAGSFVMSKQPYQTDIMMFALDGAVALIVFAVAYYMIDFSVLRRINNAGQIEKGNIAVAKVEFCAYLALGIVMNASFAGGGDTSVIAGLANAALFSLVGLATVMVVYTVYTVGWTLRGCNLDDEVLRGNQAAAIEAGSLLLALSVTLWFSIVGDFTGWAADLRSYMFAALFSVAAVAAVRTFTGLAFQELGRTRKGVHHKSTAKATLVGVASVLAGLGVGLLVYFG